ncbi:unnamed protein product [Camellia sinensis]
MDTIYLLRGGFRSRAEREREREREREKPVNRDRSEILERESKRESMSIRGGSSSNGGGGGGLQSIPAASRKMVQSLKEIVNCPESEIYAMLKECNMDPNETVNRLLSQEVTIGSIVKTCPNNLEVMGSSLGTTTLCIMPNVGYPFHEVKSKREKKKENKDTTESRPRGVSNTSNRGGRGGTDRYVGHGGSTQFSSYESGALYGKPAYKKENGINNNISPSSAASGMEGNNTSRRPPVQSDHLITENKATTIGTVDGVLSSSQPSSGYQPLWSGVPGQVSMADIVKMGRMHGKTSSTTNSSQYGVNHHHVQAPRSNVSHHDSSSSDDHVSKVSELNPEPGVGSGHHVSPNDDWPLIEQPPAASVSPVLEPPVASELHADASNLSFDRINQHPESPEDEVHAVDDDAIENINVNHHAGSASVSSKKIQEDNSGGASLFNSDIYKNMGSYQPHRSAFECQEVEDVGASVSSVTSNLQQLSVQEDQGPPPEEDNTPVIIPNHLQVQTADCSHLSFGSFGSGMSVAFPGPFSSRPLNSNMEEASADANADASLVGHSDTNHLMKAFTRRNPEYYEDEPLRTVSDGNLVHRTEASAGNYDTPSSSQPEVLKHESTEAPHENQYIFPSTSNYNFENGQQLNAAFPHSQTSSQMQNLAPFASVMAYTNSLPNSLLAANVQPVRESDIPYSPFPMTQSMPTKYGTAVSSIGGSNISIPEALKTVGFASTQPTAQTHPGSGIPQHLAVHQYSQQTVPLGPFANMIGYPFLPQSYYMPSAFQQAFAGNSTYHQSLPGAVPQYKNSVSVSSLPPSAAIASGYGGFGSSTSIPGNFPMNPPAAPGATNISYDDLMSSQYKDANHLISLQQRMRTQPCGSMGLVLERCQPFQPAHITASRDRLNSLLDSGKLSNLHRIMEEVLDTQISTILRLEFHLNINSSSKTQEMVGPSVAPKASNLLSSLNSYGKTATNLITWFFRVL